MLVWLASYPRSGNTLLRILLNRAFGVKTPSIYDDPIDIGADPALAQLVGHRSHGLDLEAFVDAAESESGVVYAKTHELPRDEHKAIYVVRDGRAAIVSLHHYLKEVFGIGEQSLADVITGFPKGLTWSTHVWSWVLSGRRDTLLLRFEDLVADPASALRKIADFLDLPPPGDAVVRFADLQAVAPRFFRRGDNAANIAELSGADLKLFWELHGQTMARMGYGDRA